MIESIPNYDKWKLASPPDYEEKEQTLSGIFLMIQKRLIKIKEKKENVK